MSTDTGYFEGADRTRLFFRVWNKMSSHGCVLLHGYGDHSGRYEELVQVFSDLPISFYAFDLRGQGRSEGKRVFANSFNDYVADCYAFLDFLEKKGELGHKKLFLFGHSLGGLIAVRVALERQEKWNALILSSPCFQLYGISWSPFFRFLTKVLDKIFPELVVNNLVRPRYLFRDPVRMKEYLQDPLIERRVAVHLANEIINNCREAQQKHVQLSIPVLVLASGEDRIVSLLQTKRWFEQLEARGKTIYVYPGFYHEIFNELEKRKPIEDVRKFFIAQIGEKG